MVIVILTSMLAFQSSFRNGLAIPVGCTKVLTYARLCFRLMANRKTRQAIM